MKPYSQLGPVLLRWVANSMLRDVLRAFSHERRQGRSCVFISVVETRGSTPQKAGAAMLVLPDGSQVGTLGGGCVEAEIRRQAFLLLDQTAEPKLLTFTLDDDYGWDDGLICGGRMTFIAQPAPSGTALPYFDRFAEAIDQGAGVTEAVVIDAAKADHPVGARWLFDAEGQCLASHGCPPPTDLAPANLVDRPRPSARQGIAFLPILPRCRVVIVGGGHVGLAVAELASKADFDIWIVDDRDMYCSPQRFPMAERLFIGDIGQTLRDLPVDSRTYCLVITRGHSHDEEALYHLATKPARYVGMIGSRRKIEMILSDLLREGIDRGLLEKVYAPLGIEIGSQTVPEIAISIVAQLIGHRNLGPGAFPPPSHAIRVSPPPVEAGSP